MNTEESRMHKRAIPRMAYSIDEVADRLGVSRRKVWQELKEGRIAHFRVGRRVLMTEAQLNDYVAKSSVESFDAQSEASSIVVSKKQLRKKPLQ
jgi:excisionase family DNA binding protein